MLATTVCGVGLNDLRLDVAAKKQDLGQFNCAATSSRVELSRFGDDAALLGI
jgi:hypothetical protein